MSSALQKIRFKNYLYALKFWRTPPFLVLEKQSREPKCWTYRRVPHLPAGRGTIFDIGSPLCMFTTCWHHSPSPLHVEKKLVWDSFQEPVSFSRALHQYWGGPCFRLLFFNAILPPLRRLASHISGKKCKIWARSFRGNLCIRWLEFFMEILILTVWDPVAVEASWYEPKN